MQAHEGQIGSIGQHYHLVACRSDMLRLEEQGKRPGKNLVALVSLIDIYEFRHIGEKMTRLYSHMDPRKATCFALMPPPCALFA